MKARPYCQLDADGTKKWYLNGVFHRDDGPAVEKSTGDRLWYRNGKFHRTDGPAIEGGDGYKGWLLNGKRYYDLLSYCNAAGMTPEETTFFLLKWQK